ncbi:MAG: ATP-grasp domain-containing protein [Limosilactobacillus sp.]|uniref:ATP-grasp domain-containing protein n=1 Tax=Limosilactobacillus sp. TaxID=2773925 RepID=UPI0026F88D34|nr:ATP-grasp domain-containing protein [Limosilactobacillus sp.]
MSGNVLYPGSTLGIIAVDHNSSALIAVAKKMGFNVGVYVQETHQEFEMMADFIIVGSYTDKTKLTEFGENCDAIIYQTPNIEPRVIKFLSQFASIPQGVNGLEIVQDRLLERAFLAEININIAPYVTVVGLDDVYQSIDSIGYPALLKPIQRGLGERSMMIKRQSDIGRAGDFIDTGTYLLESWIDHTAEYTMTASTNGTSCDIYPLAKLLFNEERRLVSVATPAIVQDDILTEMQRIVRSVAKSLQYRGVFSVNFYVTPNGSLYVKNIELGLTSIANVYDSSANVSQYEQQIRATAGMPLHTIRSLQTALFMVVRKKQEAAIQRQWLIKDNWRFRFFSPANDTDEAVVGYTWVTGSNDLRVLQQQVDDTEVCQEHVAPSDDPRHDNIQR